MTHTLSAGRSWKGIWKGGEKHGDNTVPGSNMEGEAAPEDSEEEEGHSMRNHDGHIFFRDRLPDDCGTVSAGWHCGDTAADRNPGDPGNSKRPLGRQPERPMRKISYNPIMGGIGG